MRHVFVIGLDPFNLETMQGLREARRYEFHPLLPTEKVLKAASYDYDQLVADADAELRDFDATVDGIVTWWDFPSTGLLPVVTELWDLYGPSLKSVVTLEHKTGAGSCGSAWSHPITSRRSPPSTPSPTTASAICSTPGSTIPSG